MLSPRFLLAHAYLMHLENISVQRWRFYETWRCFLHTLQFLGYCQYYAVVNGISYKLHHVTIKYKHNQIKEYILGRVN